MNKMQITSLWLGASLRQTKVAATEHYDIEQLVNIWNSGWQNIARLECVNPDDIANEGFWYEYEKLTKYAEIGFSEIIMLNAGLHQAVETGFPSEIRLCDSIIILAMTTKKNCFDNIEKSHWRNPLSSYIDEDWIYSTRKAVVSAIKKTTNSFSTSLNYGEALTKLTKKDNFDMFKKYWSKRELTLAESYKKKYSLEEFFSCPIQARWQKGFKWLNYGLANPTACEEAWWNCVWLFMEPIVNELLKINENINSDIPLTDEQIQFLNYQMDYGSPHINTIYDASGKCSPRIIMQQTIGDVAYCDHPYQKMSDILLLQPVYALAQKFQDKCKKPRFIVKCRAPSCGKRFYSGRKNAKDCPTTRRDSKSECALEWLRYKRYLQKIGQNPEKDWKKKKFIKAFISYDKS